MTPQAHASRDDLEPALQDLRYKGKLFLVEFSERNGELFVIHLTEALPEDYDEGEDEPLFLEAYDCYVTIP